MSCLSYSKNKYNAKVKWKQSIFLDKIIYRSGSLTPGEIILEINDKHVAGYTQTDSITLIKDSGDLLYVTSVYPG